MIEMDVKSELLQKFVEQMEYTLVDYVSGFVLPVTMTCFFRIEKTKVKPVVLRR